MELKTVLDTLSTAVTQLAEFQSEIPAKEKAKYDEGFAAGVTSTGSDKLYSQAELDAKTKELSDKIVDLEQKLLDLQANQSQAVSDAVASFKADLKAKFAEKKAKEDAVENEFGVLLD